MKKQIITIAGRPGSGKSTTAKLVAAKLGFEHFSSGDLFRQLGAERGVDVLKANRAGEITKELDILVDGRLREIGAKESKKVIDSRTAWHWIPDSFKVFLDLDVDVAAHRILANMSEERKASEHIDDDPAKYARLLRTRLDTETHRYKKLYNIDPYDLDNYDLIIDTSASDVAAVVERVVESFQRWTNQE